MKLVGIDWAVIFWIGFCAVVSSGILVWRILRWKPWRKDEGENEE